MDSTACFKNTFANQTLAVAVNVKSKDGRPPFAKLGFSPDSSGKERFIFSGRWISEQGRVRGGSIASKCGSRDVASPLKPQSLAGKFLRGVLQNQEHLFQVVVAKQLEELAADRDGALARHIHSLDSTESCLHRFLENVGMVGKFLRRLSNGVFLSVALSGSSESSSVENGRIAEMKESECQIAIEEVMYMLIVHKFSEIQVPLVPRLTECVTNGVLEMWLPKDREMESIHGFEVVEMIREHLSTVLCQRGTKSNDRFTDNWMATRIHRLHLGRVYAASILYSYFLKSACQRHRLELNLALALHHDLPLLGSGCGIAGLHLTQFLSSRAPENVVLLGLSLTETPRSSSIPLHRHHGLLARDNGGAQKLKGYVMGFDAETLYRCARLKSQEAVNVVERHSWALFGDDNDGIDDDDEVVTVPYSSLKRLVLEAIAFGSFLWDAEAYVDSVYMLKEN